MKTHYTTGRLFLATAFACFTLLFATPAHAYYHVGERPSTRYGSGPSELLPSSSPMAKANPLYLPKNQDNEPGLLYYGYRYYNASTGRWLSRDPMEEGGGRNLFALVLNDPVGFCDFLGECCCCCAEWLSIEDLSLYQDKLKFGHHFVLRMGLYYPGDPGEKAKSCTLAWKEKTNIPPPVPPGSPPINPDQEYDVIKDYPLSDQAQAWARRKQPCGGAETAEIPDTPALSYSHKTATRVLDFEFVLESAPDCPCANKSITKRAQQTLTLRDGRPVSKETAFTYEP